MQSLTRPFVVLLLPFALLFVLLAATGCASSKHFTAGSANAVERKCLIYDVRDFGATGDGRTLDTRAINHAIETANREGGGTVYLRAGTYLCYSIRLKSNVALYLDQGATIVAADPKNGHRYDNPEPNEKWEFYQDFGHTHWRNSLI